MRRHVKLEGHQGIFFSEHADGTVVYECRYIDSLNRERWKTTGPDLERALDFQADIRVRMGRGDHVAPYNLTLEQVVRMWEKHPSRNKLAPNSVKREESSMRLHILPTLGHRRIQKIDADMIAYWLYELNLSESSKNSVFFTLRSVMSFAAHPRRGFIPANPCDALERGERPKHTELEARILTPQETEALLGECLPWFKPILQTAMLTGMRASEICGLRWQDVDFPGAVINVRGQVDSKGHFVPTKGGWARTIPLLPALHKILFALPTARRFGGGQIFVTAKGLPYDQKFLSKTFASTRKKAGISSEPRPFRLHDCRHTFASALLRDGKDVLWVAQMLGHRDPKTTLNTYAHVINREDRVEEAQVRLAGVLGSWAAGGAA